MTTTAVRVPAGWYADPLSADENGQPTHRRWWDGHGWTHHAALIGETPTSVRSPWSVTVPESPDISPTTIDTLRLAAISPTHLRKEAASIAETMSLHSASPASVSTPAHRTAPVAAHLAAPQQAHGRHREVPSGPTRAHTASLWLIATMPITQVLVLQWVVAQLPASSAPQTTMWLGIALPFVLYAALASQDARQLSAAGHLRTVPWIVALVLPPVYVGVRGILTGRATGASPWPALVTWGALQATVVVTVTLVDPGWLTQLSAVTAL